MHHQCLCDSAEYEVRYNGGDDAEIFVRANKQGVVELEWQTCKDGVGMRNAKSVMKTKCLNS